MKNIIYENGLSSSNALFLSFIDVDKIYYGTATLPIPSLLGLKRVVTDFMIVYSKKRNWMDCPWIFKDWFEDNYYEKVERILKEKCPHAEWKKIRSPFKRIK